MALRVTSVTHRPADDAVRRRCAHGGGVAAEVRAGLLHVPAPRVQSRGRPAQAAARDGVPALPEAARRDAPRHMGDR